MLRVAAGFLLLLPLLAAPTQAVPIDDAFRATGSVRMEGPGVFHWTTVGAALHDDQDDLSLHVDVPYAYAKVLLVEERRPTANIPYRTGIDGDLIPEERVLFEGPISGRLRLDLAADASGTALILPTNDALVLQGAFQNIDLAAAGTRHTPPPHSVFAFVAEADGHGTTLHDMHTVARTNGTLDELDDAVLVASGGNVHLPNGTVVHLQNRRHVEDRSAHDPATQSGMDVYESTILVLDAPRMTFPQELPWRLAGTDLDGELGGRATWRGVTGVVTLDQDQSADPEVLDLTGRFHLAGALAPTDARWRIDGNATAASVDFQAVVVPAAPVVGGLTLLGVVATLLAYGRTLVAIAVGRVGDPLENETRRNILRIIHDRQSIRITELQEETGLSRGALRYHIQVLRAGHVLQAVAHGDRGRNTTYVLNGGSLTFRASEIADGPDGSHVARSKPHAPHDPIVAEALGAAATHPVRRAVYTHLLDHGPTEPDALHTALQTAGPAVARSTLSYHLRIMADAGLVRAMQRDGRKCYVASIDATLARNHQYRNLLQRPEWRAAAQTILTHGPMVEGDLVAQLVRDGHRPRASRQAVEALRRRSILQDRPGGLTLHATVAASLQGAS